jgi:DNA (cytosine-5)-methyltransferase 1
MPGVTCRACAGDAVFLRTSARPDYESIAPRVRIVDLFAGGGGLSLGMAEAAKRIGRGSRIVLAVEERCDAAAIYARNFPGARVLKADVAHLFDGAAGSLLTDREARLQAQVGNVHVLLAGPPCQGHSDLNNHTRRNDPRNDLYLRVARAAEVLLPMSVLVENVPTIRHDAGSSVPRATQVLERVGYTVATAVVDLLKVGVPQRRRRHILLASRHPRVEPDLILSGSAACSQHGPRTVRWAIEDLLDVGSGNLVDVASVATAANRERMAWLFDHDEYNLPNHLRPKCHHADHSYVSMYGRLRWDDPAQTITTGYGSMGQGRYVHPARPRTITPHEAARLQTLPDFFDLRSDTTRSAWAHVIGNAVPPLLGVHLGIPLLQAMSMRTKGSTARPGRADVQQPAASAPVAGTTGARPTRPSRVPPASNEVILRRMRSTRRRDTKPELALRSELHRLGLRFFVDKPVVGTRRRADILFPRDRLAVYVDGCYWHGCPIHGTTPKQNMDWWIAKLAANRARDEDTVAKLCAAGWTVLRFWEHDDPAVAAGQVRSTLRQMRDTGADRHPTCRSSGAEVTARLCD